MDPLLQEVQQRIVKEQLSLKVAAQQIGVTQDSLERHLKGDYVRSDSLAKYRIWLKGQTRNKVAQLSLINKKEEYQDKSSKVYDEFSKLSLHSEKPSPGEPNLVVDLFSGCGGLSLGFEQFGEGEVFNTVLALDIEEAMVRAYNDNLSLPGAKSSICRQIDLADFLNEAEVLAFYLDHLTVIFDDDTLEHKLDNLPITPLSTFKQAIAALDQAFLDKLQLLRSEATFRQEYSNLSPNVLSQTSVIGFHRALALPVSSRATSPGPLVWSGTEKILASLTQQNQLSQSTELRHLRKSITRTVEDLWEAQVQELQSKITRKGKGQLASSARRIAEFLNFLNSDVMGQIKSAWIEWRSQRDAMRTIMFQGEKTFRALRAAYVEGREVAVLLGGPPCQGFSRIGRGKIRSLREHGVHVQADAEAGDVRNRLLYAYVLFVSALSPKLFLFENVRHFQAEVKTPEGTFLASEILAEAIHDISHEELTYKVASRIIDSSRHLIPQRRERFFMIGVRSDHVPASGLPDVAKWCTSLIPSEEIPVRIALEGLPEPYTASGSGTNGGDLARTVETTLNEGSLNGAASVFTKWVRMPPPAKLEKERFVDAHHIRAPRTDDAAFYKLLGPGTRWMDYRCDSSNTMEDLKELLSRVEEAVRLAQDDSTDAEHPALRALLDIKSDLIKTLSEAVNGSLSLRLLLEGITPQEGELHHHLLAQNYLNKKEGNHGDWLARLHPDRPSKTIVSHMGKDTYGFVHPFHSRTLSVREAARIQSFPDWFKFGSLSLVDAFRVIGNAVPPLLGYQLAGRIAQVIWAGSTGQTEAESVII
jgi:DNA-cytosine methyltransferase